MKAASIKELKTELNECPPQKLIEYCLSLAKFKMECKELLTYLLFEADNEASYIEEIKLYITNEFDAIDTPNYYYIKKAVRKILRNVKKYIRFSKQKETLAALLLHFCTELKNNYTNMHHNTALLNIYNRQMMALQKTVAGLHEDLQYDYQQEISALENDL